MFNLDENRKKKGGRKRLPFFMFHGEPYFIKIIDLYSTQYTRTRYAGIYLYINNHFI